MSNANSTIPTTLESRLFWIETAIQIYEALYLEATQSSDVGLARDTAEALEANRRIRDRLQLELDAMIEQQQMDAALEQSRIEATGIPELP